MPVSVNDEDLKKVATFRSRERIPVSLLFLMFRHTRSSQVNSYTVLVCYVHVGLEMKIIVLLVCLNCDTDKLLTLEKCQLQIYPAMYLLTRQCSTSYGNF